MRNAVAHLPESETRSWITTNCKSRSIIPVWQEPRSGGTMGAPDCWLPSHHGGRVGVEAKVGWTDEQYVCFTIRPAQIRYHHVATKSGDRTAILVTVCHGKSVMWRALLPGTMCPKSTNARVPVSQMLNVSSFDQFLIAINCHQLWEVE